LKGSQLTQFVQKFFPSSQNEKKKKKKEKAKERQIEISKEVYSQSNKYAAFTYISVIFSKPFSFTEKLHKKLNSVALVRKLTTPIERPPLVGKVSAMFCG
jgi:hypothetical protein